MALTIENTIDLTACAGNPAPKVVSQLSIIHESSDGELVQYYNSTMAQVKKLLEEGLISEEYYWQINTKMKAKYRPVSDGLISENELICALKRA